MTFTILAPSPHPRGWYEIPNQDGEIVRYPRVTSILGVLSRPGLGRWREKLIREGRDPDAEARDAADRGTTIHALTEAIDLGASADCPSDLLPFIAAYRDWKAEYVQSVEATERLVVHRAYRYAGKLDKLVRLTDGRRAIVDLKTGRSLAPETALQLTAYDEALIDEGIEPCDVRLALHLPWTNPGVLTVKEYDEDERDRRVWRSVLRAWKWQHAHRNDWRVGRDGRNGV
jgi:RecB family exonuclease